MSVNVGSVRLTIGLGDIALVIIAIFIILAYFNGWG
jgi:hypothetical protein